MMEANTVDTPMNDNRAGDQMIPMPETMPGNAYRGKSIADNLNYPQTTPSISNTGGSMPTQSRDTWSDWFDDADQVPQLTRDELVDMFADQGVNATTLRYWQNSGIMPAPTKRRHEGATRALYPAPYAYRTVLTILDLQKRGYSLQQIAERLPRRFRAWNLAHSETAYLMPHATAIANEYTERTGNVIERVQITVTDDDGETETFSYEILK